MTEEQDAVTEDQDISPTFWVGLGASAGGLEALRAVAKNLVPGVNAIYVIVQHMSPQHKSLLASLIGRETDLDVVEITDDLKPVPNTVYVAPSNADLIVKSGHLKLLEPSKEFASPKPSVDRFFRSMADHCGKHAIGIVVSGTGSDGTYGVDAIRAAGGYVIAQSEDTAKYFGMPDSAIKSGAVDSIMAPEDMGSKIAQLVAGHDADLCFDAPTDGGDPLSAVMAALRSHGKVDFSEYKPSTVRRRIERRITALGLKDLDSYAEYMASHPPEVSALFKDMLISVTSFFRDPVEYTALADQLKPLLADCENKVFRIWVPGCATGEEAFSIAILILEGLGGLDALDQTHLQIFATDVDVEALTIARRGFYPSVALEDVPEDLRNKYFTRSGGGYTIHSSIRDCVIFTNHNLCEDPPFSNIDLITCRNLLIYFSTQLQQKVMTRLHYALNPNGLMLLGKSESLSGSEDLFRQLSSDAKVYRPRTRIDQRKANVAQLISKGRRATETQLSEEYRQNLGILQSMFDALVRAVGPDCLLVTSDFQIKRVYGNVDQFISLSEGDVRGVNIGMIRSQFRHEVRTLTTLALRDTEPRFGHERPLEDTSGTCVQIAVYPLPPANGAEELAVVAFRRWEVEIDPAVDIDLAEASTPAQVAVLERELNITRNSLQQTVEELETTNEELQALNEELQSGNEELQSTNEELETANEELQSTNEELITVNEELQINSQELSLINQELDSILANIPAPTLVVDHGLHIIRCSESARDLFSIDPNLGRPHLSQCVRPPNYPDLAAMIGEVIQVGSRVEQSFETDGGAGKIIAAPYFNPKGELTGATAIVSEGGGQIYAQDPWDLLDGLSGLVWQKDSSHRIIRINQSAAKFLEMAPKRAVGKSMKDVAPFLVRDDASDSSILETMEPVHSRQEKNTLEDGRTICHLVSRIPYQLPNGDAGMYVICDDISDSYRANLDQRQRNDVADLVINSIPVAIEYVDSDGMLQLQNEAARALDGEQDIGREWAPENSEDLLIKPDSGAPIELDQNPVLRALRGEVSTGEVVLRLGTDGTEKLQWSHGAPVRDETGQVIGAVGTSVQMPGFRLTEEDAEGVDADGSERGCVLHWNTLSGDLVLSAALTKMLEDARIKPLRTFSEFRGLIHLEDGDRFDQAIDAHLNDKARFACAFRMARPDGDDLWLDAQGQAVWANDGAPTQFIISLSDVTETWAERREIDRRNALAEMAEETGGLAAWRLDLAKMRVELSEAAAEMLSMGAGEGDVAMDLMLSAIRKEDRVMVRHGIRSVADEAVPFSTLVRRDAPDEGSAHLQISGRAERDPSGTVIGVIGIVREAEPNQPARSERSVPHTTAAE
ncbi:MAG: chemotaxis protein CheB [Pseudomonadota bacterium]